MQRAFQPIESIEAASSKQGDPLQLCQDALSCCPCLKQSPTRVAPRASSGTTCQQVTEFGEIQHYSLPAVWGSMPDPDRKNLRLNVHVLRNARASS